MKISSILGVVLVSVCSFFGGVYGPLVREALAQAKAPAATASNVVDLTSNQTVAGAKTFSSSVTTTAANAFIANADGKYCMTNDCGAYVDYNSGQNAIYTPNNFLVAGVAIFNGKVTAAAGLTSSTTTNGGTITLSGGTGSATVFSGSHCACTDTTANVSVKCAVSSTTLTATGTGTDVISYVCL